ncbi:CinA family protein [Cellulomonas sp. ATA003]|uniref:CinA family protein n=1 Tax=Cellulomonas sp. ATA003 TaxID=3073064 RepID=UPI0037C041BF
MSGEPGLSDAAALVAALAAHGRSVAVAESLTGGMVTAAVVDVPGASRVLRGGVVAYATDLKAQLLGVDRALLARVGAVDPGVAGEMAQGVRARLGADVGLATTGVAGPDPQDGHAPGRSTSRWPSARRCTCAPCGSTGGGPRSVPVRRVRCSLTPSRSSRTLVRVGTPGWSTALDEMCTTQDR